MHGLGQPPTQYPVSQVAPLLQSLLVLHAWSSDLRCTQQLATATASPADTSTTRIARITGLP